jgi:hypothetical protein
MVVAILPVARGQTQDFTVSCPPLVPIVPNQNYVFNPKIILYQSFVEQGAELFIGGSGFSINSTVSVYVKQQWDISAIVLAFETERNGTFLQSIRVGDNMPVGAIFDVWGIDKATGTQARVVSVQIIAPRTTSSSLSGSRVTWTYHYPEWYAQNKQQVDSLIQFADATYDQYAQDFGFSLSPLTVQVTNEGDNMSRLYVGWASGTTIGFSANLIQNDYLARSFITHEMANIFQGNVTGGWPWADAKGIWNQISQKAQKQNYPSPYPYVASARVLKELGDENYAQRKLEKAQGDCGVSLLWTIYEKFGWTPYTTLFNYLRQQHINLSNYDDETATTIIMVFMSAGTGYDYISLFNEVFNMRGVNIPQSKTSEVYNMFSGLPSISNLQPTGIQVTNESIPIPEYSTITPVVLVVLSFALVYVRFNHKSFKYHHDDV